jgi:transcriptional regulator with XRE-family HTH domain
MNVGNKIRLVRKKRRLNMRELASRVGVSYLTIYRIETGKVSPSVALLSEIAHHLGEPIVNFFDTHNKLTIVRAQTAPAVESEKLRLELMIPKGIINEKISVALGRTQPGEFVSKHSNNGFELTYILKGEALFKYGGEQHEIKAGDLLYFDANIEHSVTALTPHEFLSIYFRN